MIKSNDIINLKKEFTDINGKCLIGQIDLDDLIYTLQLKEQFESKVCDLQTIQQVLENGVWYLTDDGTLKHTSLVNLVVMFGGEYSFIAGLTLLKPQDKDIKWSLFKERLEVK